MHARCARACIVFSHDSPFRPTGCPANDMDTLVHRDTTEQYGYGENDFQNSKRLYERAITLPLYPSLTKNELQYIADIFLELWLKNKKD